MSTKPDISDIYLLTDFGKNSSSLLIFGSKSFFQIPMISLVEPFKITVNISESLLKKNTIMQNL